MSKHRTDLVYANPIPQPFLDALMEYVSTFASPNFVIDLLTSTTIRVPAGAGNDQVSIGIEGKFRFNAANADAAAPGGLVVGENPVFVVSSANSFTPGGPFGETDTTDYSFRLKIMAQGSTPSGTGSEALWREVGAVTWNGTAITAVGLTLGANAPTSRVVFIVGDGTNTSFVLTHNFGSRDVEVSVREMNSPYEQVFPTVLMTSPNTLTVSFSTPPGSGAYSVLVTGGATPTPTPPLHETSHLAGGSDPIPWGAILNRGTRALRPASGPTNAGYLYSETDTGALVQSDGAGAWNTWFVGRAAGELMDWPGPLRTAPAAWELADGAAVARASGTYDQLFAAITWAINGIRATGSPIITTLVTTEGISVGTAVEGAGIPGGAKVLSVDSATQITLTANATSSGTSALRFFPWGNGDGASTFNKPDFVKRATVGAGQFGSKVAVLGVGKTDGLASALRSWFHVHGRGSAATAGAVVNSGTAPASTQVQTDAGLLTTGDTDNMNGGAYGTAYKLVKL